MTKIMGYGPNSRILGVAIGPMAYDFRSVPFFGLTFGVAQMSRSGQQQGLDELLVSRCFDLVVLCTILTAARS